MENVLQLLVKRVLKPLGLIAVSSAIDATINKKMFGSGNITLLNQVRTIFEIQKYYYDD